MKTLEARLLGYAIYRRANGRWSAFNDRDFHGDYRTRKILLREIEKHEKANNKTNRVWVVVNLCHYSWCLFSFMLREMIMDSWIVRMNYRGKVYYYADHSVLGCVTQRDEATKVTCDEANQIAKEVCSGDCSAFAIQA